MNKAAATFAVKKLQGILANHGMREIANDYLTQRVGKSEEDYESLTDPKAELDAVQDCLQFIRDKGMRHVGTADSIVNPLKDILGSSESEPQEPEESADDDSEKKPKSPMNRKRKREVS